MVRARLIRRWVEAGLAATFTAIIGIAPSSQAVAKAPPAVLQTETQDDSVVYPDMVGSTGTYVTRDSDTLIDLARKFKLGFTELVAANPGIDPWIPGKGRTLVLPTGHLLPNAPRKGIVLNLIDQRLYYFNAKKGIVETFAIGTGRQAWNTPLGSTTIVRKQRNPVWYPPKSIREDDPELPMVVPPGPDNPLGRFAMYLGFKGYLIHSTNKPWGVGRRVSHGCVRMYPEDIRALFPRIPVGTPVTIVSQEVKVGRFGGQLLLEVHPSPSQTDEIEATGKFTPSDVSDLAYKVVTAAGEDVKRIDWKIVKRAELERSGVPVNILKIRAEGTASDH